MPLRPRARGTCPLESFSVFQASRLTSTSNAMNSNSSMQGVSPPTVIYVCAVAIPFYDHLLTMGMEIRFMWKWPLRPMAILFIINRYFCIVASIIRSFTRFQTVPPECLSILHLWSLVVPATGFIAGTFQLWRISALYNHDKRVLASMSTFLLVFMSLAIWAMVTTAHNSNVVGDQPGCYIQESTYVTERMVVPWICVLSWEVTMICLTIAKTWRVTKETREIRGLPFLSTLLLRDGVIYFLVMAIICVLGIIAFYTGPHGLLKGTSPSFAWLITCISSVMISRLMLNLKERMGARIVDGYEYDYNTVDVTVSNIILDGLELHNLGPTIYPDTTTS